MNSFIRYDALRNFDIYWVSSSVKLIFLRVSLIMETQHNPFYTFPNLGHSHVNFVQLNKSHVNHVN